MIEKEDFELLDNRYVKKDECIEKHEKTDEKISNLKSDIASIKTRLNMLIGILSAIGVAVLGVAVKMLFGG